MRKARHFLSAATAVTLSVSLAACSGGSADGTAANQSASSTETVTFTHPQVDDLEIEFASTPQRIVCDYYAVGVLESYGLEPIGVFGYGSEAPVVQDALKNLDAESIGKEGEIDIEKLVDLQPDVIVGHGSKDGWTWFDDDVNKQLLDVAPFIPLATRASVDENLESNLEIAAFLGADKDSDAIKKAKQSFEDAKQAVSDAAKDKDLVVLLGEPGPEVYYTAMGFPQTELFESLGLTMVGPDKPKEGNPWGQVPWEEFPEYKADVVGNVPAEQALDQKDNKLWSAHPAVAADQVLIWDQKLPLAYDIYANWLDGAAKQLASFKKVTE